MQYKGVSDAMQMQNGIWCILRVRHSRVYAESRQMQNTNKNLFSGVQMISSVCICLHCLCIAFGGGSKSNLENLRKKCGFEFLPFSTCLEWFVACSG